MKKTFIKAAAPALAIGLAFSGQAGAEAANPNANAKAEVNSVTQAVQYNGASLSHRLSPVENRLSSVESEVASIVSELANVDTLTPDQFEYYQGLVDSLFGRVNASTNQLQAVTKKFDDNAPEIVEVEIAINEVYNSAFTTQNLLDSIEVVPEEPIDTIEDGIDEVIDETDEVIDETDEVIDETVEQ